MPELNYTILKNNTNLKAYYRMESGALTTDSSGNGVTLTNNNTVGEGTGVFGGAADGGASNSNKSLTSTNTLGIDGGAISMSFWIKLNSEISSSFWAPIYQGNNTSKTNNMVWYEYNSGTRRLGFYRSRNGVAADSFTYNVTLGTSVWHHIVYAYDGTTIRGYLDGKYIGAVASSGNGSAATDIGIGILASASGGATSSCLMDDVSFFNIALSADQIKELYEGRTVGELWPQAGLVAGYHLNGNSTDFSGNNNHGTDTAITYSQANGKFNQGAGFNGTSSVITFAAKIIPQGAKTVSFWLKSSSTAQYQFILTQLENGNVQSGTLFSLNEVDTTGKIRFVIANATTANQLLLCTSAKSVNDGVWHQIVGTWDGTTAANAGKIYVDGALEGVGTASGAEVNTPSNNLKIGNLATFYLTAAIDEFQVYNVAKDANWVRKQYAWSIGKFL